MTRTTYESTVFLVVHDQEEPGGTVWIQDVYATPEQPQMVASGMPIVEEFLDKAERDARAEYLGYVFPDPE